MYSSKVKKLVEFDDLTTNLASFIPNEIEPNVLISIIWSFLLSWDTVKSIPLPLNLQFTSTFNEPELYWVYLDWGFV